MKILTLLCYHDINHQDVNVPDSVDVNQDSELEIIDSPGFQRAQLGRVANLLEYYHPPTHMNGELCDYSAYIYAYELISTFASVVMIHVGLSVVVVTWLSSRERRVISIFTDIETDSRIDLPAPITTWPSSQALFSLGCGRKSKKTWWRLPVSITDNQPLTLSLLKPPSWSKLSISVLLYGYSNMLYIVLALVIQSWELLSSFQIGKPSCVVQTRKLL